MLLELDIESARSRCKVRRQLINFFVKQLRLRKFVMFLSALSSENKQAASIASCTHRDTIPTNYVVCQFSIFLLDQRFLRSAGVDLIAFGMIAI